MLHDKVIIYDDSCPMCRLYTWWFVAWGFLKPENRVGFASAPPEITDHLDLNRGRHEIPLFDRRTHETLYGLRALTFVLGDRWTWLKPLFASRPFFWMFYPLYQIITYNRRVMAGCGHCEGFDCAPDLNRFYRSVYLGIAILVAALTGLLLFVSGSGFASIAGGLMAAVVGVALVTGSIVRLANGSLAMWNHLGNYASVLIIVSATLALLAVWPAIPGVIGWTFVTIALLLAVEELRRRS